MNLFFDHCSQSESFEGNRSYRCLYDGTVLVQSCLWMARLRTESYKERYQQPNCQLQDQSTPSYCTTPVTWKLVCRRKSEAFDADLSSGMQIRSLWSSLFFASYHNQPECSPTWYHDGRCCDCGSSSLRASSGRKSERTPSRASTFSACCISMGHMIDREPHSFGP